MKYHNMFENETRENYFQLCLPRNKKIGGVKQNIPRIKSKIDEEENEGKRPGGKTIKDMLRCTMYYEKD